MIKMKTVLLVLAVALSGLAVSTTATAEYLPSNESQQRQVDSVEMMAEFMKSDAFVPSRLELRKISSDVVADLIELVDSRRSNKVRGRAIQSLALYMQDDRAVQALETVVNTLKPGHELFPAALVSYGQIQGEKSVDLIAKYVEHRREDVRMAAIVALGRYGGQSGMKVLGEVVEAEDDPVLRDRIASYL
ncbi:MAG: HEAT repeat domain-containing protein [Myxococcota bacterium]